ncbi:MAG: ABC transporter substrate-binding protein [Thermoflexus sp.]|uniref:ABC transporter substrate-binding protein n=1 Tax=Thermoflexus sp. TaxID=1969742 RepID=UPI0025EB3D1B|nr:ABC transporter substrate-binding protein [Thermoflexus sp.]MCS6964055.1 ABC transporter substrate-binding protein [Thermoflexus sp.]MDW8185197.1 ABC transporter substrate-binding protein [Anaerolineae bacterium]
MGRGLGILLLAISGLLGGIACRPARIVYIGLVAPFEGRDRAIGYDVIFGARLAVRAWNAAHPQGPFVMLVALDDQGDPALAQERARQIASHPGLMAVIGHFRPATTKAAAPIYRAAGIPLIAPLLPADRIPEGALPTAPDQRMMVEALLQALPPEGERSLWIARDEEEQWFGPELAGLLRERGWVVREAHWEEASPQGKEPVLFDGRAVHAAEAARRWRREGWQGPLWGGPGLLHPDSRLLQNAGEVWIVAETRSMEDREWVEAYRAIALGATPGPYAPLGYDLVWVLMQMQTRAAFQWEGKTGTWKWEQGKLRKDPAWFLERGSWLPH